MESEKIPCPKVEDIGTVVKRCESGMERVQVELESLNTLQTSLDLTRSAIETCRNSILGHINVTTVLKAPLPASRFDQSLIDLKEFEDHLVKFEARYRTLHETLTCNLDRLSVLKKELEDKVSQENTGEEVPKKIVTFLSPDWLEEPFPAVGVSLMDAALVESDLLNKVMDYEKGVDRMISDESVALSLKK